MVDAMTVSPAIKPVAAWVPYLSAPFIHPLLVTFIPTGAPLGEYEMVAAFFDPSKPMNGKQDAFLEASAKFTIE